MGNRVEGKVAIVTGAGSIGPGIGNGKAASIVYAREGAKVMLVDCSSDSVEETKVLINKENGECLPFIADVSKSTDCRRIIEKCIQVYGRVDILHNNVGIEIAGRISDISEDDWDRVMDTNLKSMFLMCKYAIECMELQRTGSIINISSINAICTLPAPSVPYSVSKAGVIALTREIAVQYASKGIRANAILPGMMNTPMVAAALKEAYGGDIKEMTRLRDALVPLGKQGEPWDTANIALFLASDEAKYITGATIVVDGGLTCKCY